jgi:hypothetical protein
LHLISSGGLACRGTRPEEGKNIRQLVFPIISELPKLEADLAQTVDPEDAHRIAFSPRLCSNQNVFGGIAPPAP